jgi:hypothetical protein
MSCGADKQGFGSVKLRMSQAGGQERNLLARHSTGSVRSVQGRVAGRASVTLPSLVGRREEDCEESAPLLTDGEMHCGADQSNTHKMAALSQHIPKVKSI